MKCPENRENRLAGYGEQVHRQMRPRFAQQHHFRCVFELQGKRDEFEVWSEVVRVIRLWISRKVETDHDLGGAWFFTGGEWRPPSTTRALVETRRCVAGGTETVPEFWGLRYEHPCTEIPYRQWRTDVGLTAKPNGSVLVSLATTYWLLPGYFGIEPKPPVPTSPRVIHQILDDGRWTARVGATEVSAQATVLGVGSGDRLCQLLEDPNRGCPLILATPLPGSGKTAVDTARLSRLLAGAAVVVRAEGEALDEELSWLIPVRYRCWGGAVRVYQPAVRLNSDHDYKRHRFFSAATISELGATTIEEVLARCVTRWTLTRSSDVLTAPEDVDTKARDLRLAQLRQEADDTTTKELLELLEAENSGLRETTERLNEQNTALHDALELARYEVEEVKEDIARVRREAREQVLAAEAGRRAVEGQLSALSSLSKLPETLCDMVDLIERLHPRRVVFTDKARRSAKRARINDVPGELPNAWRCLWAMATILYDLLFGESEVRNPVEAFRTASGFELALTETKQTKLDKNHMGLRTDTYKGEKIDITPHVKYGSREPRCLRVHYHAHPADRVIVVGHCGDHLDTYGTQRR